MFEYKRKVPYHETDKMGITHHANYIKWMEEARIAFLDEINLPFRTMEEQGIASAVLDLSISYKRSTTFGDTVLVAVSVTKYTGVQLEVSYTIRQAGTGIIVATAASRHCFLKDNRVISLQRVEPKMHDILLQAFERYQGEGTEGKREG